MLILVTTCTFIISIPVWYLFLLEKKYCPQHSCILWYYNSSMLESYFESIWSYADRMSNNHTPRIEAHRSTCLKPIFGINCSVVWELNFLKQGVYATCTCLRVSWSNMCMWNIPGTFLIFRAIVSLYIYKTQDLFFTKQYFNSQKRY